MSYRDLVESLGVQMEAEFKLRGAGNDNTVYRFTSQGLQERTWSGSPWRLAYFDKFKGILDGIYRIVKPFKVKKGDRYFTYDISESGNLIITDATWEDSLIDYMRYSKRFVFEDAAEAFNFRHVAEIDINAWMTLVEHDRKLGAD